MKKLIASVSLAATTLFGASLTPLHSTVQGDYVEARTADVYTGPASPTRKSIWSATSPCSAGKSTRVTGKA